MKRVLIVLATLVVVILMVLITPRLPGYEPITRSEAYWRMLGVLVVHAAVGGIQYLLHRWRPRGGRWASFGVYLVLAPLGLWAWMTDPWLWFLVPLALVGVVILWAPREAADVEAAAMKGSP